MNENKYKWMDWMSTGKTDSKTKKPHNLQLWMCSNIIIGGINGCYTFYLTVKWIKMIHNLMNSTIKW